MLSVLSILNLISVLLSITFQILLIRVFGVHLETDIYYLSILIIQFIHIFLGFVTDLYIPFYNDIRTKDEKKANEFQNSIYSLVFFISIIISALFFFFSKFFIKIFARGFEYERILFASSILKILSIYLLFLFLNSYIEIVLKANFYVTFPFFMNIFPPFFNLLSLIFFSKTFGIKAIIYSMVFSTILIFLIYNLFFLKKLRIFFINPFKKKREIFYLIKQNILVKLGGMIWGLNSPIMTNVLSYFPIGYITLFTYTNRFISFISDIINSPIFQVFYLKVSRYLSENNIEAVKNVSDKILRATLLLFFISVLFSLMIFKKFFLFLFYPKLTFEHISIMYFIFLSLIPYYTILIFESIFKNITLCMKKGLKVLQIAIVYIILYSLFLISTINYFKIYSVPFSLFFAQTYNAFSYFFYVNKKMKVMDKVIMRNLFEFSLFFLFLIILNFFLENKDSFRIFLNLFLFLIFYLKRRNEIYDSIRFLMRKGEIK
ncbi:MAG: lipid II flippase MurJ [candidate division WOR-3 bacterium]